MILEMEQMILEMGMMSPESLLLDFIQFPIIPDYLRVLQVWKKMDGQTD